MRLRPEEKRRIFVSLIITIISIAVYFLFQRSGDLWRFSLALLKVAKPILWGLFLAFIINILMTQIEKLFYKGFKLKKAGWIRMLSILLSYLIFLVVMVFLVANVVPKFIESLVSFISQLPVFTQNILDYLSAYDLFSDKVAEIQAYINSIDIVLIRDMAIEFLLGSYSEVFSGTINFLTLIASKAFSMFLIFIFSLYALSSKENLVSNMRKLMYSILPEKWGDRLNKSAKLLYKNFYQFFTGQFLDALLLGTLCFIGMTLLSLPYPLMISLFVGFMNMIPYFGSIVGAIISTLMILLVEPIKGLVFLIFIIVLQQLDGNYINPKLVGSRMGIPSIWILFSITVGGSLMGIFGMIIFVPLMGTLYILLKHYANDRIHLKGINVEEKKHLTFDFESNSQKVHSIDYERSIDNEGESDED